MQAIKKVLNVNAVLVTEKDGSEKIFLGSGIGFGKKVGELAEKSRIERVFSLTQGTNHDYLVNLFSAIPSVYFAISDEIVEYAKEQFSFVLEENINFVLTDHLYFAVERFQTDMMVANRISWEIRNYYPKEYKVGVFGLSRLKEHVGVELPEDEAANIAFHIVNQQHRHSEQSFDIRRRTELISAVMSVIRYTMKEDIDSTDSLYARFVTHMQYFVERFFDHNMLHEDEALYEYINANACHPFVLLAMERINNFFVKEYGKDLPHEELAYLGLHINRLYQKNEK